MKTFLNVLYRRILYKIPLKLLLLLLVVFGVLFACFSKADIIFEGMGGRNELGPGGTWVSGVSTYDSICISVLFGSSNDSSCTDVTLSKGDTTIRGNGYNHMLCIFGEQGAPSMVNNSSSTCIFVTQRFNEDDLETYVCSPMSSLECQTEYNLIPISSVDQNYCTTNNLCPSCPVCPSVPVGTGGYSQLYINNILHLGAPNIIMNIPDEIDWDYAYTQGGQNMNIDVVGYNVDYEKIDSIVQFQNYKPTSEDFQKIIGLLAPYTKIIVFFVFLFIVWAWIKKPFKSKKL